MARAIVVKVQRVESSRLVLDEGRDKPTLGQQIDRLLAIDGPPANKLVIDLNPPQDYELSVE